MDNLYIIGTSTTAEIVYQFVTTYNLYNVKGFAVNQEFKNQDSFMNLPLYSIETLDKIVNKTQDYLFVAIQWNKLNSDRKKVFEKLKFDGYKFANIISPNSLINGYIRGENCWIADHVVVDFGVEIRNNTFIKIGATICDNTIIGEHCFIGAKATIAGGVNIGQQCFIGVNATIFDCVTIGKKCIIGAASVVKRNVPDFTLCKVNTENTIIEKFNEQTIIEKLQFKKNVR